MTNEFPALSGAFSPLGSCVFAKSRIARYFASFSAALLRAIRRMNAAGMPRPVPCKSFAHRSCGALRLVNRPDLLGELVGRQRVEHVALANARASRHRDGELDRVETADRVCIAREHELDAALLRFARVHGVEIQAIRIAVDLDRRR